MQNSIRHTCSVILLAAILFLAYFVIQISNILLFIPYKLMTRFLAKLFRKDLVDLATGLNSMYTVDSPSAPNANIILAFEIDGFLPIERFRSIFFDRVYNLQNPDGSLVYQKLRQTFTHFMGFSFYKKESRHCELNHHVRLYDGTGDLALPNPCTDYDLRAVIPGLVRKPWGQDQSPWEMLVIYNFKRVSNNNCDNKTTMVLFRFHHSLGDGYSFLGEIMPRFFNAKILKDKRLRPDGFLHELKRFVQLPKIVIVGAKFLMGTTDGTNSLSMNSTVPPMDFATGLCEPIDVNLIKEVKNKLGTSYFAVLLALIAGSVRRLKVDAGLPVPKRITCSYPELKPGHPGGLSNHMSLVAVALPLTPDVRNNCRQIEAQLKHIKKFEIAPATDLAIELMCKLPTPAVRALSKTIRKLHVATIHCANFPVISEQWNLDGLPVTDQFHAMGNAGLELGVNFSTSGINNQQRIFLSIEKHLVTSLPSEFSQRFHRYLMEELGRLSTDVSPV